jgi:DNA-directed RNA polymerase subunit beta'
MKENVICGYLIPAGTGLREFERIVVGAKDEAYEMRRKQFNPAEAFASFD